MANRFLELMDRRGKRSLDLLKSLYRAASKRVHPDAGASGSAAFLTIRREYEEALDALHADAGAQPWTPGAWNPNDSAAAQPAASSRNAAHPRHKADPAGKKKPPAPTIFDPESSRSAQGPGPSAQELVREPPALGAFRDACARLGADIASWDQDPYRHKPSPEAVTELLLLAHAVSSGRLERELACLETVLASLLARRAELARYPGIMTRYAMLYRAFAEWDAWRSGRGEVYQSACRTRLVELENPTVTILRASAIQDITDAFPGAAKFLRVAWGLPGDQIEAPGR